MNLRSILKSFFTVLATVFSALLFIWAWVDIFQHGFSWWSCAVLVYLMVVGVAVWLNIRGDGSAISSFKPTNATQLEIEKTVREIVLEAIRRKGKAQRKDLLPLVAVSKSTLVRLLDQLEAEGLVEQIGERKASYYQIKVNGGAGPRLSSG